MSPLEQIVTNNFFPLKVEYAEIVVRLVSWLNAHLTSRSHNSVNFHPILKIKVSKFKLQFYLSSNTSFTDIYVFKAELWLFKAVSVLWDTLYVLFQTGVKLLIKKSFMEIFQHLQ